MIPATDILPAIAIAAIYVALFLAFEMIGRRTAIDVEITRKGVHIGAGLIALSFPTIFASHLTVLVLGSTLGMALLAARKLGLLPSVHGVDRYTIGELLYPVAIYGSLLLSTLAETPHLYPISILLLAFADGLAGIVGSRVRSWEYPVFGGAKTLAGSATFLVVAFVIIAAILSATVLPLGTALLVAAVSSLVITGLEAISTHGTDNLTVSLGGWCVVMVELERTPVQLAGDLVFLVLIAAGLLALFARVRGFGVAGAIFASLVTFGAWLLAVAT